MGQKKPSKSLEQAALQAQREAEQSRKQALQAQENMRINFMQNLGNEEQVVNAVAGGTAEELGIDTSPLQRRRRQAGAGLSSTLGIGG